VINVMRCIESCVVKMMEYYVVVYDVLSC